MDWEQRLITNKDRIHRVMGNEIFFRSNSSTKFLRMTELVRAFDSSLKKTRKIAALNPRLAVGQAFVDTKNSQYRLELLLPLIVEFPLHSTNYFMFAVALDKPTDDEPEQYSLKSILTLDMAYSNARLVGYVDASWMHRGTDSTKTSSISHFFWSNK